MISFDIFIALIKYLICYNNKYLIITVIIYENNKTNISFKYINIYYLEAYELYI